MPGANKLHPTRRTVIAGGLATGVLAAAAPALGQTVAPNAAGTPALPPAPRDGTVDIVHGTLVPDPFRPLENPGRKDVAAWVAAQDARTRAYLASLPTRAPLRAFLNAAWNRPWTSIPVRHGSRYFASFNDGRARHNSYGVQDGIDGPRRTLIDPETLSHEGSISIYKAFSDRRGTTVAYLVTEAGSDKQTLRVRDVDTGQDLPDTLLWCNLSTVAWRSDGSSFFYTRYPNDSDPADWDRESHIICLHRLGEPQSADRVIFRLPALRDIYFSISSSLRGRSPDHQTRDRNQREDVDATSHRSATRRALPKSSTWRSRAFESDRQLGTRRITRSPPRCAERTTGPHRGVGPEARAVEHGHSRGRSAARGRARVQ